MRIKSFVTTAALVLASAITFAQNITFDYDRAVDFSKLRTYAWVRGTPVNDALNDQRIVRAVDSQLSLKGVTRVERNAKPDLLVAYHAAFGRDLQISGFESGWGGYRFGGMRSGTARTEQILTGTLIIDIVDAQAKTIVWRGVASKDIDVNASPEKREKNINKTADKLFKNYPPKR